MERPQAAPTVSEMTVRKPFRFGALLAAGLLGAAGAGPPSALAIVDGERVAIADAPWAVSFTSMLRGRRVHFCSATVIAPRRVLTARHCVDHHDIWQYRIVSGSETPERTAPTETRIARVWSPILFDWDKAQFELNDSDLAVIETTGDLRAPALPLSAPDTALVPGEPVWTYGYGFTNHVLRKNGPALLRRAQMRLYARAQCAESDFGDVATALCAQRAEVPGGGVIASGDSGGGLVRQGAGGLELVGVNSAVSTGEMADRISGFASVPALHAFVTAPESGHELPIPRDRATWRGTARVGARLRCSASFNAAPTMTHTTWRVTPRRGRARSYVARGSWKVPSSAAGQTVACSVFGGLTKTFGSTSEWSSAAKVTR
jgi:hypothetical protein